MLTPLPLRLVIRKPSVVIRIALVVIRMGLARGPVKLPVEMRGIGVQVWVGEVVQGASRDGGGVFVTIFAAGAGRCCHWSRYSRRHRGLLFDNFKRLYRRGSN